MLKRKVVKLILAVILVTSSIGWMATYSVAEHLSATNKATEKQMQKKLLAQLKEMLPQGAKVLKPKQPKGVGKVLLADMSGDGAVEALVFYVTKEKPRQPIAVLFTQNEGKWHAMWSAELPGFALEFATFADVDGDDRAEMLVGSTVGASAGNVLDVYRWNEGQIERIGELGYHRVEVEDMPNANGELDGKAEIAIWTKDTGEAYAVEVVRWENDTFVPATDVYRYYFPKVVQYYKALVEHYPDAAVHWYYLADASLKAGNAEKAIKFALKGKSLTTGYPKEEQFDELIALAKQAR